MIQHSIKLNQMIGYSVLLIIFLLPSNIYVLANFKTACELLKLPRECHCQRTRGVPLSSLNETRLRCRQFTKITNEYNWPIVQYDRLAFETPNDNLILDRFAFSDIRARTLRFNVRHLFLNDHAFYNAYIGQLAISCTDDYGTINLESNGQALYGATITNILVKSIDLQIQISELFFSNSVIYTLLIESSKFYGFTNKKFITRQQYETNSTNENQYETFLEYDSILTPNSSYQTSSQSSPLKIRRIRNSKRGRRQISDINDEKFSLLEYTTAPINITSTPLLASVRIYTILSSINTTNLTENYFPNNFNYNQTDEITLSYNYINTIDPYAFRHLQFFEGRLILTYNHIQYLSPYAFNYLYSLNNLSLANNLIQNVSSMHFEHLNKLYELDLGFNQINQLYNNTFQYLPNLHVLRLNNNPLKFIHSNVFTSLTHLKEINLQGVQLMQLIDPQNFHWLWNLASLNVNYLSNTNFDLSDVAFCLLSHFNQTFFHISRQHSCSCNVHYLYNNPGIHRNGPYSTVKYHTNYLRLTPICIQNETSSSFEQYPHENEPVEYSNSSDFIIQNLGDKCNYKLMFLDCDAMTTTTTATTTTTTTTTAMTTIEISSSADNLSTAESLLNAAARKTAPLPTTTPRFFKYTKPTSKSANNTKKLFTVLGTLIAITVAPVILVILWYRLKRLYIQKQKRKKVIEQKRGLNSISSNNMTHYPQTTAPRYASSDMLSSMYSGQSIGNKNPSQTLISPASPPSTIYKNVDALNNDSIQSIDHEENQLQRQSQNLTNDKTSEIQETTEC
ncbi:unnamed protein product [Rotaria socialis]|nr:unnamed protein product [Rotaria socialis]CAF4400107.1 unnamed protein product [Rotaria socialis]